MKVSATFTSWLLSNHTTKMTKLSIQINSNLKFGMVKLFKDLHNVVDVDTLLTQIKIFE